MPRVRRSGVPHGDPRLNLLLLTEEEARQDEVRLSGRRARHVHSVLGAVPGQRLKAGVVRGPRGRAEVLTVSPESVTLRLELDGPAPEAPPVDLVLAVPRPKVLRRVLAAAASLGVDRVDLVNAWRVEKSYFASPHLRPEALERAARLGCEQGAHTWVPMVEVHPRLMPFLDEVLPGRAPRPGVVLHPGADRWFEDVWQPGPVRLVLGPEGGFIPRELDTFVARGFTPARVSSNVLSVESVVPALLAQTQLLARIDGKERSWR